MTAVAPSTDQAPLGKSVPGRVVAVFVQVLEWIARFAGRLPGQDTVSKMDAFETFRQEISYWQVAAIFIVTPLPFFIFNIVIELIPLSDPATGFWGSGCYQLRMFLTAIYSAIAPATVKLNCVPNFPVNSPRALASYGCFEAIICLGTNMIISLAANVFPVPFSQFTVIIPMAIAGRLVFFRQLPDDPQFHALSKKVNQWLSMETLPILVYPVFTAVFMILSSTQQLWLSLLLPVLKLSVRRMLWAVAKNDDDLVGVMTCCVGHLYHILFTAMILQNSKTLETLGVVAIFNTGQMIFNCRYILADSRSIDKAKRKVEMKIEGDDSVCIALDFAQEFRIAQNLHWRSPSLLLSTYPGYRGTVFMTQYEELLRAASLYTATSKVLTKKDIHYNAISVQKAAVVRVAERKPSISTISLGFSRIMPWSDSMKHSRPASERSVRFEPRSSKSPRSKSTPTAWSKSERVDNQLARREAFIHAVASALHQTEMILLRSYVTICMTAFYVIYLLAVFRLTNRHYFATLVYLTTVEAVNAAVTRLLLLCGMETIFLVIYLVLIWKRLGISGVYQLAFVLYSQRVLVQAKFYLTIIILGFPLTHNGNDSILRFDSFT